MKFSVEVEYLDPIKLGEHEHVEVVLPDGRHVTVFSGRIYIRIEQDVIGHKDGKRIWDAGSPGVHPYGVTQPVGAVSRS